MGTDHCPGFGSSGKIYRRDIFRTGKRLSCVHNKGSHNCLEVMGRNAGWLTAASSLARVNGGKGPNLIYLCEKDFDNDRFINDVSEQLKDNASVLVAIRESKIKTDDMFQNRFKAVP